MTPEQFCYWLQGRAEMQPDNPPSEAEWKMIAEHLALVFKKVTPTLGPSVTTFPNTIGPAFTTKDWDEAIKRGAISQTTARC